MAFFKRTKQTKVKGGDDEVGTSVTEAAGSSDGAAIMTDGETKEQKKYEENSDENRGDKKMGGKRSRRKDSKAGSVRLTSATSADPQDEQQVGTYDGLRQAVEPEVSRLGLAGRRSYIVDLRLLDE